ncbi:MAG: hypothetical protein ACXVB9_07845 [Bdellovibrionota bacterium]
MARWEAGHSKITWKDFLSVCERINVPIETHFAATLHYHQDPGSFRNLVDVFCFERTHHELLREWKISKATLNRWLAGKLSPPAELVFQMIAGSNFSLKFLIESMFEESTRSIGMRKILEHLSKDSRPVAQAPWDVLLLCLIDTETFAFEDVSVLIERLARHTGLTKDQVSKSITHFKRADFFRWDSQKMKNVISIGSHINTAPSRSQYAKASIFWSRYALECLQSEKLSAGEPSMSSFLVFNCNETSINKIRQANIRYFREIEKILQTSGEGEQVFVLGLNLVRADTKVIGTIANARQDKQS